MQEQLETIWDMKYVIQEMTIDNDVEYEIVGEWVRVTKVENEKVSGVNWSIERMSRRSTWEKRSRN